jgi:photosystem II stability/assembly factor-like uncharacterized protein
MRSSLLPLAAVLLLAGCASAPSALTAVPAAHTSATPSASPTASTASSSAPGPRNGAPCRPSGGVSVSDFFGAFGRDGLTDVQFVSPEQGWVVGQHVILATDNGGASWTVQRRGDLNLVSVDFISADVGWAVGLDSLLRTSDGGRNWISLPEPCGVIRSVHFISPQAGYAVAGGVDPVSDASVAPTAGGAVLFTANGGVSWEPRPAAPADVQSVCFSDKTHGWLGASGELYETSDAGARWKLRAHGPAGAGAPTTAGVMFVQCATGSVWALDVGPGAASSQEPHIGYYARPFATAVPLFAEQYFPHPGVSIKADSPGSYFGPVSAINAGTAAFIDFCPACGYGTAPWLEATSARGSLIREGNVGDITQAFGASFVSTSLGWVVGTLNNGKTDTARIVRTDDGGRTWQVQYRAG